MDMMGLLKIAREMHDKMGAVQRAARELRVRGEAEGGLVQVEMDGQHQVQSVHIDPSVLAGPADVARLQRLVLVAVNAASARVAEGLRARLGGMAGELGIDPSALAATLPTP